MYSVRKFDVNRRNKTDKVINDVRKKTLTKQACLDTD